MPKRKPSKAQIAARKAGALRFKALAAARSGKVRARVLKTKSLSARAERAPRPKRLKRQPRSPYKVVEGGKDYERGYDRVEIRRPPREPRAVRYLRKIGLPPPTKFAAETEDNHPNKFQAIL